MDITNKYCLSKTKKTLFLSLPTLGKSMRPSLRRISFLFLVP